MVAISDRINLLTSSVCYITVNNKISEDDIILEISNINVQSHQMTQPFWQSDRHIHTYSQLKYNKQVTM